jgi:hypothetical protein
VSLRCSAVRNLANLTRSTITMKSNNVLILAVTTTLPLAALADSTGCPKGIGKHTGTHADVLRDGKDYNLEVDSFSNHVRYGELPDGRRTYGEEVKASRQALISIF